VSDRAQGVQERIAHFGHPKTLVGVVTLPPPPQATRNQAVVILNVGVMHRVGPNRLHVQLARQLAREGFVTLRFDLSGIGDSDPRRDRVVQDVVRQDVADALSYLETSLKATSFVLVGLCSGANISLRFARRHASVVGAVLLDPYSQRTPGFYLRHYSRRLFRWRSWRNALSGRGGPWRGRRDFPRGDGSTATSGDGLVAPPTMIPKAEMEETLAELIDRGVQLLHVFTGEHEGYNYERQLWDAFPRFEGRPEIRVKFLSSADHTFRRSSDRRALIALIRDWLTTQRFAHPLLACLAAGGQGTVPFAS
jgi:pimeloyl-ACP methyl ester carboxylesterase